MIKKPKQLGKVKESIVVGRALRGSCLALAVFALVFIFVPYVVAEASAANLVRLNISWGEVQLRSTQTVRRRKLRLTQMRRWRYHHTGTWNLATLCLRRKTRIRVMLER